MTSGRTRLLCTSELSCPSCPICPSYLSCPICPAHQPSKTTTSLRCGKYKVPVENPAKMEKAAFAKGCCLSLQMGSLKKNAQRNISHLDKLQQIEFSK